MSVLQGFLTSAAKLCRLPCAALQKRVVTSLLDLGRVCGPLLPLGRFFGRVA